VKLGIEGHPTHKEKVKKRPGGKAEVLRFKSISVLLGPDNLQLLLSRPYTIMFNDLSFTCLGKKKKQNLVMWTFSVSRAKV